MDEWLAESALALRDRIARRELSPVELVAACLRRIEALDPAVNAICALDVERAFEAARIAESRVMSGAPLGPLHGLPVGIKDLEDTAGLLTTKGNITLRGNVPAHDALLVQRLKSAGAIVLAKTNTPDMGAGANTRNAVWGATGNPFDPQLNAGGSSGGSAAALAVDMLPLCSGSDLGGSLRIPAALCGVVGMRPSPGLVPSESRALAFDTLSVLGPMARCVSDLALMLAPMTGADPRDPLSGAHSAPLPADATRDDAPDPAALKRLSVGWTEDFGICAVDEDIRQTFRERIALIAPHLGRCEPLHFDAGEADRAFDILRAERYLALRAENSPEFAGNLSPNVRANLELAQRFTLADRAFAHLEQSRLVRRLGAAMQGLDLVLAPVTPVSPFPWATLHAETVQGRPMRNYYHWLALTYVITLTTHPALSLPCGRDRQGMPFGLQLVGRLHGDQALLSAARTLERLCQSEPQLARARPDLAALRTPRPELRAIVTHPPG